MHIHQTPASERAMAEDRSCVHLCMRDWGQGGTYTVHHLDAAPFFSHPDPDTAAMDDMLLPPAAARFDEHSNQMQLGLNFHLLGAGGRRVLSVDGAGRSLIYDARRRSVRAGPKLSAAAGGAVTVSAVVGDDDDDLYVLNYIPVPSVRRSPCFKALRYDRFREDWRWHALPEPPYVRDPGYQPSRVRAHTVAAGGAIWTYTEDVGTYSFDTGRRSWKKEGDWALPFVYKAEHVAVPGCGVSGNGLTFGFLSINGLLCAVDLATATAERPPEVLGVWKEFKPPSTDWFPTMSSLVHLGSGKLCVFRFFSTDPTDSWRSKGPVAVVTGVEVHPADDGGGDAIVKHRSRCIKLGDLNTGVKWVL